MVTILYPAKYGDLGQSLKENGQYCFQNVVSECGSLQSQRSSLEVGNLVQTLVQMLAKKGPTNFKK